MRGIGSETASWQKGLAMADVVTTQRERILRLWGIEEDDSSWRQALWPTHEAVSKRAKVFGAWLLTLRGRVSSKALGTEERERG